MAFIREIGELGEAVVDTATSLVTGIGQNFTNSADYNSAVISRVRTNDQIALSEASRKARQAEEMNTIVKWVVFVILLLLVLNYAVIPIIKLKK